MKRIFFSFSKLRYSPFWFNLRNFCQNLTSYKWYWIRLIRLMKFETVWIHPLSDLFGLFAVIQKFAAAMASWHNNFSSLLDKVNLYMFIVCLGDRSCKKASVNFGKLNCCYLWKNIRIFLSWWNWNVISIISSLTSPIIIKINTNTNYRKLPKWNELNQKSILSCLAI